MVSIATLGSHTALNIFKGAKEEGFSTVCVCKRADKIVYDKFPLVDEFIWVDSFPELLEEKVQRRLLDLDAVLIPHGSFTAYLDNKRVEEELEVPVFGNKKLLSWETSRERQREWLCKACIPMPKTLNSPDEIKLLAMVKFPGAKGGKGYFLAYSKEDYFKKSRRMLERGLLTQEDLNHAFIQEYVIGVNIYPLYFHSILTNEVEFLGADKRYESIADNIGRIPADEQMNTQLKLTYSIVGNIPLTIRESLLPEFLRMGERVVEVSRTIAEPGIIGPFCLETVVKEDLQIVTFEISARIVAGANVGIGTSPYLYLRYGEGMYMGRRVALEIRKALEEGRMDEILT